MGEEGTSTEKIFLADWPVAKPIVHFFIDDWYERFQITVGSATHGLVVLGAIRKQAEQARRSKPVSSILL